MKKALCFVLILILIFSAAGCVKNDGRSRLYLIYMNGSDLETNYAAASKDLAEIMSANISAETRIIVQTGGTEKWHNENINPEFNQRFELKDNSMEKIWEGKAENMGKASTLSDFIVWGAENYRADEYYLILWNHGGGAISGFGKDETFESDTLLISELNNALSAANEKCGIIFNMIAFDACLMASIECLAAVKDYCEYVVASQELVPVTGFEYKSFFNTQARFDAQGGRVAKNLAEIYFNEEMKKSSVNYLTASVISTQALDNLMEAFRSSTEEIKAYLNKDDYTIAQGLSATMSFGGKSEAEGYSNMVDLLSFAENFAPDSYEQLYEYVNEAVIYKRNGLQQKNACGISVYYPKYATENLVSEAMLYASSGFCPEYADVVKEYTENLTQENIAVLDKTLKSKNTMLFKGSGADYELIATSLFNDYYVVTNVDEPNIFYRVEISKINNKVKVLCKCFGVKTSVGLTEQKYIPE